ncbi:reverse transcriptase domain-containing protein [Tanacetum coccineum]|uniref:Reverse transcriptase domain-containing protein n=1 Tax=Tanacetum coccineum TaxID=301880 RepID=A0ABQ5E887_9ASTR
MLPQLSLIYLKAQGTLSEKGMSNAGQQETTVDEYLTKVGDDIRPGITKLDFKGPILRMTPAAGIKAIIELSKHSLSWYKEGDSKNNNLNHKYKRPDEGRNSKLEETLSTFIDETRQSGINKALADLGASISLIPYSMFLRLNLCELKPTRMCIELANKSTQIPRGIAENVIVKIDRLNPKVQDVVKAEIVKLLDAGLIYAISDSPWVSHIHVVPKKGGIIIVTNEDNELVPTRTVTRWRVCIDYRKLNDATRKYHFLFPFIDQMLERLSGNEYYCFLDGFSGYFQIPLAPEDQEKTTFTCPFGTFAYRRMPFGLCNVPATFQQCMTVIFHDMCKDFMEVFIDDFSVFGNSVDSCLNNLSKMLARCEETNLVLNWEKCHFMVKEGIILGHKISKARIEVDKAKVDVIAKSPYPTNIKGIRSFLGNAGFYKRFIKDFSKIARPMTQLLMKDTKFVFSSECIKSFDILRNKLTTAPIIIAPNWDLDFKLMCDASDYAEFTIEIKDKKGSENLVVDHLSRLENPDKHLMVINIKEADTDPCLDGIVRLCVFGKELHKILKHCHTGPIGGHYGADITARKIFESRFYWPTIFKDSVRYVQECDACQRARNISSRNQMPLTNVLVSEVFDIWGIDFIGPFPSSQNNKYILVTIDYILKWVEAEALPTNDARVVVKFLQKLFSRFGFPKALISNRRTTYKAPIRSTPFRIVYRKACHLLIEMEDKAYWALKKINLDLDAAGKRRVLQLNQLDELRKEAYEHSRAYKERTKWWHDAKIMNKEFREGEEVLVFNSRLKLFSRKLRTRWYGLYTVSKVCPYGTVEVPAARRQLLRPTRPIVLVITGENELARDGDFLNFSAGLLHFICLEAKLEGVSCLNSTLPVYFISLM